MLGLEALEDEHACMSQGQRKIIATIDPSALGDAGEGLEAFQDEKLSLEAAIELARIEDVEAWARTISACFEAAEETVFLTDAPEVKQFTVD